MAPMTKRNSTKPKTLCIDLRWIDSSGVGMYIKGIMPRIVDHMSEMSTIGLCTPGHLAGALGMSCVILSIAAEETDPDGPSAPERVRPMGRRVMCCRPVRTIPPCSGYCTADCAHCILQIQTEDAQRYKTPDADAGSRIRERQQDELRRQHGAALSHPG